MTMWIRNDQEAAHDAHERTGHPQEGFEATQLSLSVEDQESAERRNAHIIALMSMTSGKTARMLEDALDAETDLTVPAVATPEYLH